MYIKENGASCYNLILEFFFNSCIHLNFELMNTYTLIEIYF